MAPGPVLWELKNITKAFPGVVANDDISITLNAGEIHALLGENGCGKSTLIKTLSGVHQPDSGEILLWGKQVQLTSPTAARQAGVGTVFQEFSLAPTLSVAENIFLGRYPSKGWRVDWKSIHHQAREVLKSLDISIETTKLVGDLSVAEQQLVEIAKAVSLDATLLILDEPTTALGEHEIVALHALLRRMKSRGVAILYISHRLDEVVDLVDTATVLKDGSVVSTAEGTQLDVHEIVSTMVGEDIKNHYPKQLNATDKVLFQVDNVTSRFGANGASFSVNSGEVFGLGGVIGSGRTEILRALFGADPIIAGKMRINGERLRVKSSRDAIAAGMALVPENRKFDGLFFNFRGGPNITSAALAKIKKNLLLDHRSENETANEYINQLEISPTAASKLVNLLSGGNQQKIVIARWLFAQSRVLLLDEPTQGIDICAKVAVYNLINELTAKGCAVILVSSDHNELIAMSDRVGIVRDGRVVEILQSDEVSHDHLIRASAHAITHKAA